MARIKLVEIDLKSVSSSRQLHQLLMKKLQFPEFYGCNWNAFWDAITGLVEMPETLRLVGWSELEARLPHDSELMKKCLDDMFREYPEWACRVEYA